MWSTLWLLCLWLRLATCNVEKTIFTAPAPETELNRLQHGNIGCLNLHTLSPSKLSLRLPIGAEFPSETAPRGKETWLYLDALRPSQRYEVRICWLATQPTSFYLTSYTLDEILESPVLMSSLTKSAARGGDDKDTQLKQLKERQETYYHDSSSLFLLLESAADYFTHNETLMTIVPPVHADIILDPYLFNVLPESLIPTAAYLVFVAIAGWYVSGYIWSVVQGIARGHDTEASVSDEKKTD